MTRRLFIAALLLAPVVVTGCSDDDDSSSPASSSATSAPTSTTVSDQTGGTIVSSSGERHDVSTLIGETEAEATSTVEDWGATVRVVSRDGRRPVGDAGGLRNRVNLVIEGGVVTDAYVG